MSIENTLSGREFDKFVESPTRSGKTAIEVLVSNQVQSSNFETRNAGEIISGLKCVYSFDANTIKTASSSMTVTEARVFGVSITAANLNESMQVQPSGVLRDSSFTFTAGVLLFVSSNGSITDLAPETGFRTVIGTSQGAGAILINIQETITL